jgi:hypothetical protein
MARWNLAVSSRTDQAVRLFLARQGRARKGDLSRFIEEAVQAHILELTAREAKQSNADLDPQALESMVQEALDWAKD